MYRDNTLIPAEAVRLLALGLLATDEKTYAALATEVREFVGLMVGPSLELVGPPLELLKVEGLVEPVEDSGAGDAQRLRITEAGRQALTALLTANLRAPVNAVNKLIVALKVRFLHLLSPADQRLQTEILAEMCARELARLTELRWRTAGTVPTFVEWLDHDIAEITERLRWFESLRSQRAEAAE